jgi:membrane protease YdiL (CAAX protease family)
MSSTEFDPVIVAEVVPETAPRRLAVWPPLAMYFAALAAATLAQIPVVMVAMAIKLGAGGKPNDVMEFVGTPWGLIALSGPSQLAILGVWWLATTFGDPRALGNRAIGASPLSLAATLCVVLATPAMLYLGDPLAQFALRQFGEWQTDQFGKLYEHMTWASGPVFVLFIALVPAVVEELFFRGYMQRRLLARWSPAVVLPLVAVLFASMHGTPAWALGVLPVGFWFGLLAWRTGSLWPGMLCHAFINGSVNVARVGAALDLWPSELSTAGGYAVIGASTAFLLASLVILYKLPKQETESRTV